MANPNTPERVREAAELLVGAASGGGFAVASDPVLRCAVLDPKPFTWTKATDRILDALRRYCDKVSGLGHYGSRATAHQHMVDRLDQTGGCSSASVHWALLSIHRAIANG